MFCIAFSWKLKYAPLFPPMISWSVTSIPRIFPHSVNRFVTSISGEYLMSLLNCIMQHGSCIADAEEACKKHFPNPAEWEKYLLEEVWSRLERQEDYDFSGKRILIVDDMMINRDIAAAVLRQTGAETETAENGTICVRKVEAMPAGYYNLILMDIIIPDMDGLEATRRIRRFSDQEKARIPIIAMTTNASDKDRDAALEAGMNAFTEKPILVDKLFTTMNRYLQEGRHPCRTIKDSKGTLRRKKAAAGNALAVTDATR